MGNRVGTVVFKTGAEPPSFVASAPNQGTSAWHLPMTGETTATVAACRPSFADGASRRCSRAFATIPTASARAASASTAMTGLPVRARAEPASRVGWSEAGACIARHRLEPPSWRADQGRRRSRPGCVTLGLPRARRGQVLDPPSVPLPHRHADTYRAEDHADEGAPLPDPVDQSTKSVAASVNLPVSTISNSAALSESTLPWISVSEPLTTARTCPAPVRAAVPLKAKA